MSNILDTLKQVNFPANHADPVWAGRAAKLNAVVQLKSTIGERGVQIYGAGTSLRAMSQLVCFAWKLPKGSNRENHVNNLLYATHALHQVTPIKAYLVRVGFVEVNGRTILLSYPHVSIHQVQEAMDTIETLSEAFGYDQML